MRRRSQLRLETSYAVIAEELAAGNELALAWAFDLWSPLVHGLAVRALGPDAAADVTQAVFVQAWRTGARQPSGGCPVARLLTLTRLAITDEVDRRREAFVPDRLLPRRPGPPDGSDGPRR